MSLYYTKDHEWIRIDGDIGTVGISEHAQEQLGDIVFVEVPQAGKVFEKGSEAAVVESVKAASEIYSPVSGEVVEANQALADNPAQVNEDAEGAGWFFKIRLSNQDEIEDLMDRDAYESYLESIA